MLYTIFTVGNTEYKLRLNTRNLISLEKQINRGALTIFGDGDRVPSIAEMVAILHCSLQQYQHNITLNDAYEIFDKWVEEGNPITDFIAIIVDIYKVSGLFREEQEKN